MNIAFEHAWVLLLLPLALLPLYSRAQPALRSGWLVLAPRDALSSAVGLLLRAAMVLAPAGLLLALAGPHRPEYTVERVGRGAEIVLALDRSRSMDQGFASGRRTPPPGAANRPELLDFYMSQTPGRLRESKGAAARRLLSEFVGRRPDDRFAWLVFSTLPIRVLEFTSHADAVQAAIAAGQVGRGLAETNIGLALDAALENFDDRPYTGSRIVMLVSDGGDRLDAAMQQRLAQRLRRLRVSLVWIYLRSANSPGLDAAAEPASAEAVPELALHRFFQGLETPYRAYEAADAQALEHAIADVDRLEKRPIQYAELVPRRDLGGAAIGLSLAAMALLLAARAMEIRRWA